MDAALWLDGTYESFRAEYWIEPFGGMDCTLGKRVFDVLQSVRLGNLHFKERKNRVKIFWLHC